MMRCVFAAFAYLACAYLRDMLWEEELEAKRIQDDEDRRRRVRGKQTVPRYEYPYSL